MGTLLSSFPLITYTQFIKYQGSVIKGGSNGNIVILLPSNNMFNISAQGKRMLRKNHIPILQIEKRSSYFVYIIIETQKS